MKCDLCGTKDVTATAKVEGVLVNVCDNCAKFGTVVKAVVREETRKEKKAAHAAQDNKEKAAQPEIIEIIVHDCAKRMRTAREKTGLPPKDFAKKVAEKESVILHLESGTMRPNLELAKKLERALRITLIERVELKDEKARTRPSDTMTFGDLIKQ